MEPLSDLTATQRLTSRKFIVTVLGMALGTVAVWQGWIEGLQYVSIMTLTAGAYLASNVAAAKTPS